MTADRLTLFLAQGFGSGRIRIMPGTFGSFVGFFWFLLIAAPGNFALFATAVLLSIVVSILCADRAERILKQQDPGSVVIDEIIAIPICFLGWMMMRPEMSASDFVTNGRWKYSLAIVLAFRVFDIWKPWPIRQSQRLPGGLGVTIDDVIAALFVAAISAVILSLRR